MRQRWLRWLILAVVTLSAAASSAQIEYTIELKDAAQHLVHVSVQLPSGALQCDLQMPVWNATYQVREFAQYVNHVRARGSGKILPVQQLGNSTWRVLGTERGATVEYDETLDMAGPFGAQFNDHHAFLNLAMVLMYPTDMRSAAIELTFASVPNGWGIATAEKSTLVLRSEAPGMPLDKRSGVVVNFANYDRLVDSPIEIGTFQQVGFEQDGARYSVVVDADPADYDLVAITDMCKKIAAAEVAWMQDRPFDHYMFIYHFPKPGGGGGMEHAYSTAIDATAERVKNNPQSLVGVTAHEFFHLWNVKRIRPQSLEPVDYTKEQYTRALWFSEGVTSTVADYIGLRAGFTDEKRFLESLARTIGQLQTRPAHLTQSAEESSLTTWFDKYPNYHAPERSISYYTKGEILGTLLDLAILDASGGQKSLRDVFHYLNEQYAKKGRFFDDSAGIRDAVEVVSGTSFRDFFTRYVAGVDEIPYDDFFRSVGLHLVQRRNTVGDAGFTTARASATVASIASGSAADKAGLMLGDTIVSVNDKPVGRDLAAMLGAMKPGETLRLKITRRGESHDIRYTVGSREDDQYVLLDVDNITAAQRARRAIWLGTAH